MCKCYDNLKKSKTELISISTTYLNIQHHQETWYYKVFQVFYLVFGFFSDRMVQISLIIWGMSRTSVIKLLFLLIGLLRINSEKVNNNMAYFRVAFFIALFYLVFQTLYNLSFVDNLIKSFGKDNDNFLFKIGFYKYYNLFHGHLLVFKYSFDEIKVKRKDGMIWDFVVFFTFYILYHVSKKNQKS